MNHPLFNEIIVFKGAIVSKLTYHDNGTLILSLKTDHAEPPFIKIHFENVAAFHDTGFIGAEIDYVDVRIETLNYVYIHYIRSKELDIKDFTQAVFISQKDGRQVELIVVFKKGYASTKPLY